MLPQEIGGSNYVLVVQLDQKESNFTKQQQATAVAVRELARYDIFNAFYLLGWDDAKSNLKQACEVLSNARVYDRAVWKPSNAVAASLRLPPSAAVAVSAAKSNRRGTVIVVTVLIAFLAGFAFLTPHDKHNEQSGSPEGSYQNDRQRSPVSERTRIGPNDYTRYIRMLQLTIKKNWFPPRLDHSTRTVLVFKVFNNGRIGDVKVSKSSGDAAMDKASLQAIYATSPFQPLPSKESSVDIEFTLDYNLHQK
jgi:TonB family protein